MSGSDPDDNRPDAAVQQQPHTFAGDDAPTQALQVPQPRRAQSRHSAAPQAPLDAGAAAGSLVWLGARVTEQARRFARALALVLLGSSVATNAVGHGLAAYGARPAWWVVVLVSAVAPAVLGAVVHLAVLVVRGDPTDGRAATTRRNGSVPGADGARSGPPTTEHTQAPGARPRDRTTRPSRSAAVGSSR